MGEVLVGHDWAEDHHDVQVQDGEGRQLAKARLPDGVEGVARFHALLADHVDEPAQVVIATETDRGPFVGALAAAGYQVLDERPPAERSGLSVPMHRPPLSCARSFPCAHDRCGTGH